jgi:uncharacterized protein (DUF302 family)
MTTPTSSGLISLISPYDAATTANRLEEVLRANGMNIVARVDHAQAAAGAGMELRSTELLIFRNPQAGTPLMQRSQTAAIDFPQKALVWQDGQDQVWISFNDPDYLMKRHGIDCMTETAGKMKCIVESFAAAATAAC